MTASEVSNNTWFMVIRTKQWYKKTGENQQYVEASQIGNFATHNIPKDEPVELQK